MMAVCVIKITMKVNYYDSYHPCHQYHSANTIHQHGYNYNFPNSQNSKVTFSVCLPLLGMPVIMGVDHG